MRKSGKPGEDITEEIQDISQTIHLVPAYQNRVSDPSIQKNFLVLLQSIENMSTQLRDHIIRSVVDKLTALTFVFSTGFNYKKSGSSVRLKFCGSESLF